MCLRQNIEKESLKMIVSQTIFCFHQTWKAVGLNEKIILKLHENTTFNEEGKITEDLCYVFMPGYIFI